MAKGKPPKPPLRNLSARAKGSIVKKNAGAITRIAGYWHRKNPFVPFDDLFQAAAVGFMAAGDRYEGGKLGSTGNTANFHTYAYYHATNACRELVKEWMTAGMAKRQHGTRWLIVPVVTASAMGKPSALLGRETKWEDTIEDHRREPDSAEEVWDVVNLHLPPRLRLILHLLYAEGMTMERIGADMGGLSRERIRQLRDAAFRKLRALPGFDAFKEGLR